ncbi:hypothetical protein QBC33DRAFT_574465 [Phialemonium atrogriseum]|uniref:Uncharacterized protein n=1 Tax=Phialemonium atrogriseum TaxID=1093897 RepID=A0AAJ0FG95_9PEZI|nr:uncharacterized protein QBC33DRAFT_574465 [Phialemonium atrogriseum]KAK1762148.1 hypothetical protein QBC33DRAFT_574465 [Phialemonium atrogriseum]
MPARNRMRHRQPRPPDSDSEPDRYSSNRRVPNTPKSSIPLETPTIWRPHHPLLIILAILAIFTILTLSITIFTSDSSSSRAAAINSKQQQQSTPTPHLSQASSPELAPDPLEILGLDDDEALFGKRGGTSARDAVMRAYEAASRPYWNRAQMWQAWLSADAIGVGVEVDVGGVVGTIGDAGWDQKHGKQDKEERLWALPNDRAGRLAFLAALIKSAAMLRDDEARELYLVEFVPAMDEAARRAAGSASPLRLLNVMRHANPSDEVRRARRARAAVAKEMCWGVWVSLFAGLEVEDGDET